MSRLKNVLYVLVFSATSAWTAPEFPPAPADAGAARGLQCLDVPALNRAFSGMHLEQDANGKICRVEYGADGSVILSKATGRAHRSWHIQH